MRVVHAQAVKLFEELRHPGPQEADRGPGFCIGPVEIGIGHPVAPRLTLGIRAAGRRSHAQSGREKSAGAPEVAMRSADLQVPEEEEPSALELAWKESCCSCARSWPKRKNPIGSAAIERSSARRAAADGIESRANSERSGSGQRRQSASRWTVSSAA